MGQHLSFFFHIPIWYLYHPQHNNQDQHHLSMSEILPQELSFMILEYLDLKTKFIIQRVNRSQWYQVVTYWLSLQEALVFERIDYVAADRKRNISDHLTGISDVAFRQFVTMLDKCYKEYKQQHQIANLNEERFNQNGNSTICEPFKFASLKRVTLVQSRNLQNNNTLSSHFQLPLMGEDYTGDCCYHVGRSAVSLEFKTGSRDVIQSKQLVKQRFSIGMAANSSIGKRRVRHLSLYGNYVHYCYNPQWDTRTTVHSAYVKSESLLGSIEHSAFKYDCDRHYCTTIFVDDDCYRVMLDSMDINSAIPCSKSSRHSLSNNQNTHHTLNERKTVHNSWSLWHDQTPVEIRRQKEINFTFRHTVDASVLCHVLDQLNVVHNKDVIQLKHVCFHHFPSWINKNRLFNEHSFSVEHRPELVSLAYKNYLYGTNLDNEADNG